MRYVVKNKTRIFYATDYHPYYLNRLAGVINPTFDETSSLLLRFKEDKAGGFEYYKEIALTLIDQLHKLYKFDGIAIIPSHEQYKYGEGMLRLVNLIHNVLGINDVHAALFRVYTIEKLSRGGNRSSDNHIKSIAVKDNLVCRKNIILLDDVITTGNSMIAGEYLLYKAKANAVVCASLARTV